MFGGNFDSLTLGFYIPGLGTNCRRMRCSGSCWPAAHNTRRHMTDRIHCRSLGRLFQMSGMLAFRSPYLNGKPQSNQEKEEGLSQVTSLESFLLVLLLPHQTDKLM